MKTFRDAIRTKDFVLSAEVSLTADSDASSIIKQARILGQQVDAIQVTENQYGVIHMSPLAAASILVNKQIDPVMQLSCCNRNRAALIGDLLGAKAVGVSSLLLVRGKKMPDSYRPQPEQIKDVAVDELIATAKLIAEDPGLTSAGGFLIGAVTRAHIPKSDWAAPRLQGKINAGAHFAQTQICFDINVLRKFVAHLVNLKLLRRCYVVADVAVLPSAEYARWLRDNLGHVLIPNGVIRRLERAEDPEREGVAICSELLREIAAISGISGANLISMGTPEMTIQAIQESGLRRD